MKEEHRHIRYEREVVNPKEMLARAGAFYKKMQGRRSVRFFSKRPIPKEVILRVIAAAGTAPSGANKQPWAFCAISSATMKQRIRQAAEEEERKNYSERMSAQWLAELKKLGTNPTKPFLEEAPWLIAVFKQIFEPLEDGMQSKNYYVNESAGIACGILIAAIHDAGLACLTHTPSPMQFLCNILERPDNERPFLLLPVGYPSDNCTVPDIQRKPLENLVTFY